VALAGARFASTKVRRRLAGSLTARHDTVQAIELLTELNRQRRDESIEEQLVALRHRAFKEFPSRSDCDDVKQQPVDIFPGVSGIPEIDAGDLTVEALRAGVLIHGSLIVRGLLARSDAVDFRESIDRACDGLKDAVAASKPAQKSSQWYSPFEVETSTISSSRLFGSKGGSVLTADSPPLLFKYLDMIERVGLKPVIGEYLGEAPAISVEKSTLRRVVPDPSRDWSPGWHQDGAFLGEYVNSLNLWVSLSECGKDAPSIDVVARRLNSVLPTGTEGAVFDWSVSPKLVASEIADKEIIRPTFAPGDAIFFDHLNLHRTGADKSMTQKRYAIETWFFTPSRFPDGRTGLLV